jgi:hypothetical protein
MAVAIPRYYANAQDWLNQAVRYALREGCFFPVPTPDPKTATCRDMVQWGAMRNLHDAIAAFAEANRWQ